MQAVLTNEMESGNRRRRERILVVDDSPTMIPMFEEISASNFNLILADDAAICLKWLNKLDYEVDAVVTDLSMSPINGFRLTEMIREQEVIRSRRNPIKVFWMTGWPLTDEVLDKRQQLGVVKIFRKPEDDPITIINTVRSCVECPAKYYPEKDEPIDEGTDEPNS